MRKFTAILLTALTLSVSINLGVASHFCRGELAQARLVYAHADVSCGMQCEVEANHNKNSGDSFNVLSCCEDQFMPFAIDAFSISSSIRIIIPELYVPAVPLQVLSGLEFVLRSFNATYKKSFLPKPLLTLSFIQIFII